MSDNPPVRMPDPDQPSTPQTNPTPPLVLVAPTLAELRFNKVAAVKQHCRALILRSYPHEKQMNDFGDLGAAAQQRRAWLLAMRGVSRTKETALLACQSAAEIDVIGVVDGWPDFGSSAADAPRANVETAHVIQHQGRAYQVAAADALSLFGALAMALDGETARITLASGDVLELTHQDVSDIGRQLAGKPADEVSGSDRETGS